MQGHSYCTVSSCNHICLLNGKTFSKLQVKIKAQEVSGRREKFGISLTTPSNYGLGIRGNVEICKVYKDSDMKYYSCNRFSLSKNITQTTCKAQTTSKNKKSRYCKVIFQPNFLKQFFFHLPRVLDSFVYGHTHLERYNFFC